jgi:hypothetical protein
MDLRKAGYGRVRQGKAGALSSHRTVGMPGIGSLSPLQPDIYQPMFLRNGQSRVGGQKELLPPQAYLGIWRVTGYDRFGGGVNLAR